MPFARLFAGDNDEPVVVDVRCLTMSRTLSHTIELHNLGDDDCYRVPLPYMKHALLKKVAVFMKHYTFITKITNKDLIRSQMDSLPMLEWDKGYLSGWACHELIELYDTAKRLRIIYLQEICKRRVQIVKGKSLEDMRGILGLPAVENCPCSIEPCCSNDACGYVLKPIQ